MEDPLTEAQHVRFGPARNRESAMLRGKLRIKMEIEIPVNAGMYPALQRDGGVSSEDIIAAEEQNYLNHIDDDEYLAMLTDHITEVSFDFEPSQERWDERGTGDDR